MSNTDVNDARAALVALMRSAVGGVDPVADEKKEKAKWDRLDTPIEYDGRAITLPDVPSRMPLTAARDALSRRIADDEQEYRVHEIFDAYPHDAAVAFTKAMRNLYGLSSTQTEVIQTMFGKIKKPPTFLSVKTGPHDDDVVQCPLGQFVLPGVSAPINTLIGPYGPKESQVFLVHGEVKKKDRHIILELTTEARRILKEESIYRGKPIRLGVDEDGTLLTNEPPVFLDVSEMVEESIMFDDDIQRQIDTNILVPLRETEACRKHKIPLKRGILLEGPYGIGKSLMARMAARVAEVNGWTFVLLDNVKGLRVALEFAERYKPCVVFAEDIDRIAEHRDEKANDLINIIDGVVSKRSEVMTILTTNHVEKLNPVILRPGRLDAIVSIRAPGPETVMKLVKHYAGNLLPKDAVLTGTGKELAGQIPASIRECIERAKLGMIGRKDTKLSDADIVTAAQTMKTHLALLAPKVPSKTNAENLASSLQAVINTDFADKLNGKMETIKTKVEEIHDHVT